MVGHLESKQSPNPNQPEPYSEHLPILVALAVEQMMIEAHRVNNADNKGIQGASFPTRGLPGCTPPAHQHPLPKPSPNSISRHFKLWKWLALFIHVLKEQELDPLEAGFFLGTNNGSAYFRNLHQNYGRLTGRIPLTLSRNASTASV